MHSRSELPIPVIKALLENSCSDTSPSPFVRMTCTRYAKTMPGAVSYESPTDRVIRVFPSPPAVTGTAPPAGAVAEADTSPESLVSNAMDTVKDVLAIRTPVMM